MKRAQDNTRAKPPRVVCLKRKHGDVYQGCDVYIGRQWNKGGWNLKGSIWGNPFKKGSGGLETTEDVLGAYESHVRKSPKLMAELWALEGKVLGCWCKPDPCHGDILVKIFKELQQSEVQNSTTQSDEPKEITEKCLVDQQQPNTNTKESTGQSV